VIKQCISKLVKELVGIIYCKKNKSPKNLDTGLTLHLYFDPLMMVLRPLLMFCPVPYNFCLCMIVFVANVWNESQPYVWSDMQVDGTTRVMDALRESISSPQNLLYWLSHQTHLNPAKLPGSKCLCVSALLSGTLFIVVVICYDNLLIY